MKKRNLTEDYLESILVLQKKQGYVRSVDVSRELGVTKPSVCNAMKRLREQKMIYFGDKGCILFTDAGKAYANSVRVKTGSVFPRIGSRKPASGPI